MSRCDCEFFTSCEAPICPIDDNSKKYSIWFPNEEICRSENIQEQEKAVIILQQKIASKVGKLGIGAGYFTHRMLESNPVVSSNTRGIFIRKDAVIRDPREQENIWLDNMARAKR